MAAFTSVVIVTDDKTVIALRFVESMLFNRDEGEQLVDKLKGDVTMKIRTISGMESTISMRMQREVFGKNMTLTEDLYLLREEICQRWLNIIKE